MISPDVVVFSEEYWEVISEDEERVVELCVELIGVPAGGLECQIVVTLHPLDDTAGRPWKLYNFALM